MTYDCSIIIPVFNQLKYTKQCLEAVAINTDEVNYEVVIIDNGSTDGTVDFLRCLEGDVKIIKNSQNMGFSKANNQGSKVAKGKYLVFLNNDTIAQPEWLSEMISVIEKDPLTGIVGSKLLYPDGTIQHAGVVMDNGIYHIYEGLPSDHLAVNKLREFPYVTGACLLIPRDLFCRLEGFDEGYINGFEDIDLCLKVRRTNKKVIYCPKSILFHYANTSESRMSNNTEKEKNDKRNGELLFKKWPGFFKENDKKYYLEDGMISPF